MSYATVAQCANDQPFLNRLQACVADEQTANELVPGTQTLLEPFRWIVASASDVEAAYASALAAGNPNPGGDEAVITDAMILSHVQGAWDDVVPSPGPPP